MAQLPAGWKEFYSHRASAPYFAGPGGVTQWTKPDLDGGGGSAKRARVDDDDDGGAGGSVLELQNELALAKEKHAAEVAGLRSKVGRNLTSLFLFLSFVFSLTPKVSLYLDLIIRSWS
jgi:hypothetical protein